MTPTPISSLESGEKSFLWTRRTSCLESGNQSFLGSVGRNDSNTHQFARIGEKKLFRSRVTSCLESRNQTSLGSGGRNDSNTDQFARISAKKIFYELDVNHVLNMGIKRFWAQESEIVLTPIISLEYSRKNFSWTRRTSCLQSGNKRFWAQEAEMTLTPISSLESARKKFFMNSTYIMTRKWESNVFGLRSTKWL